MANLSEDHSYLYKRVRLKAIVHLALGSVLILFPQVVPTTPQGTVTSNLLTILAWLGVVYLVIGILITVGLFRSRHDYSFLRKVMTLAATYNSLWAILYLLILIDKPNRSTAYIAIIYWYLTYNIWYVRNDPGWKAIEIVKDYRRANDTRST